VSRLILMSLILTQEDVQINEKGKSVGQLANRDITWKMAVKNAVCVSFFWIYITTVHLHFCCSHMKTTGRANIGNIID